MQTVATKDPVSNHVDVTPRPDFGVERGNVLHGQFTTPGGHEALRPGAVEEEEEDSGDEYRPDYTDQVSSFWNGLSEIQVLHTNEAGAVSATGARFTLLEVFSPISLQSFTKCFQVSRTTVSRGRRKVSHHNLYHSSYN